MPQTPERKKIQQREYCARPEVKAKRAASHAAWMEKNKDKKQAAEARRRLERRASCLVATARTRARKRGLAFDLGDHIEDLQRRIDAGVCEVTGLPFDLSPGRKYNSPSLDRRDPARGYTHDNVRIVLNVINAALGDWGDEVLRDVMRQWLAREGNAVVPQVAEAFIRAFVG